MDNVIRLQPKRTDAVNLGGPDIVRVKAMVRRMRAVAERAGVPVEYREIGR